MSEHYASLSPLEHEWRTCVTAIQAAAEILRDYSGMATFERERFVQVIIDENGRLKRTFENISDLR